MASIQLGKARVAGLGLALALFVFLVNAVPRAGAAEPPSAAITGSDCDKKQVTLTFTNPGTTRGQFSIEREQIVLLPGPDGTQVATPKKYNVPAQTVEGGKTATLDVQNEDAPPTPDQLRLAIWANEVDGQGKKGKELNHQTLSKDVCANVPNPIQRGARYLVDSGMKGMTEWMMSAAQTMIDTSQGLIKSAPNGDPTQASWIIGPIGGGQDASRYSLMRGAAFIVMLFLLFAQFIAAAFTRRWEDAVSGLFVHAPVAVLLGGMALLLVHSVVGIFDSLETWLDAGSWAQVDAFITGTKNAYDPNNLDAASNQAGLIFFTAFFSFVASLAVYAELWLRALAINLGSLFIPLAFAGLVWSSTRPWLLMAAEGLLALIATKLAILVVFTTGVGYLMTQHATAVAIDNPASLIAGMLMLWAAALAPFFISRVIPFASGRLSGAGGGAGSGVAANEVVHDSPTQVYEHAAQAASLGSAGATEATSGIRTMVMGGAGGAAGGVDGVRGLGGRSDGGNPPKTSRDGPDLPARDGPRPPASQTSAESGPDPGRQADAGSQTAADSSRSSPEPARPPAPEPASPASSAF